MKTEEQKNGMARTLIFSGAIIAAACLLAVLHSTMRAPSEPRMISVTGECLTTAPKDRTAITLRVTTLDKSAATSMKQATDKITQITDFLKTQDVKMQTTQFDSYEKTEWDRVAQKSVTVGIETNIAVEVSADKMEKIEKILNQFAGQPDIYSENLRMFTSAETMKPIMEKCLGEAVVNARERANAIAAGDGRKVGKMVMAGYSSAVQDVIRPSNFLRSAAKMEAVAMDMSTGGGLVTKDTDVSVSVSAAFEVK